MNKSPGYTSLNVIRIKEIYFNLSKAGPHPRKTHKRVYVIIHSPSRDV